MIYDFDEVIDRAGTNCLKYDAARKIHPELPEDFIPMWLADMDFACPQPILDAMKARLDRRILGYSDILDPEYLKSVAGWMECRHGWTVDPSTIHFSPGVVTALRVCVQLLTQPGEKILMNTPGYHPFADATREAGRVAACSPLVNDHGFFTIDWKDFEEKAADPEVKAYFLCNPHNPTGRVWTEEELRKIHEICQKYNVFIVSDEIHGDFIGAGHKHIPLAKLFPEDKRIITCTAPSKTFNLAGNHLSNIIIPDAELGKKWKTSSPNPLSIAACQGAYDHCADWVDQLNDYLDESFRTINETLARTLPQAVVAKRQGTYLAWVDVRSFGYSDEELQSRMLQAGLFLEFGPEFIDDAAGFIRLNLALPHAALKEALSRFARALS